jgi:hypothetical protein
MKGTRNLAHSRITYAHQRTQRLLVGSLLSRHREARKWQVVNSKRHEGARLSNDARHHY